MSLQNSHQISDVKVMLVKGADGNGIVDISLTGQSGIVDTYTITLSNGDKYTFTVTNGNGIDRIEKTATHGLVDTYTIYFDNGDTETFDVTNGMGGGMSARLLINSDAGSTVTVITPSGTILTAEQVTGSTTQWYCDTVEYGVHTIDAVLSGDDAQVTVTVDSCKVYNIDDTHFHVTITATYPDGATCRCQGGDESYYADGSPYTFSVHSADTYTITVVYDGQTYTGQVEVITSGTSFNITVPAVEDAPINDINLWLMYGGVSGSYSSLSDILSDSSALATLMSTQDAVDYLVRCTGWAGVGLVPTMTSNTTPSGVCYGSTLYSSPTYDYYKPFDDVLGSSNDANRFITNVTPNGFLGYQFTTPQIVRGLRITQVYGSTESTSSNVGCTLYVEGSNDGSNYTTLYTKACTVDEVRTTLELYFDNETAYEYCRVRSSGGNITNTLFEIREMQFFVDVNVCENSSAMSYIGLNNYASNTLLADATWCEAICNSTYFESVLNVKVPTMTSNTTPSGVASANTNNADAYKAFNDSLLSGWVSTNNASLPQAICYQFTSGVVCKKAVIQQGTASGQYYPSVSNCIIKGSNDGTNWDNIKTGITLNWSETQEIDLTSNETSYLYYLLSIPNYTTSSSSTKTISVYRLNFYGREDV